MPFNKGQSGNPTGRPRKEKTLTNALQKALGKREGDKQNKDILADILLDLAIKEKNIAAIKYIYDRLDGKPTETIELQAAAVDQRLKDILHGNQ